MKYKIFILTFILFLNLFFLSIVIFSQQLNLSFSIYSMYRTCEMIEITGNEDQFDIIFNLSLNYYYSFNSNLFFESSLNINIRLPYSDKARFYEYFKPEIFELQKIGFLFSYDKIYLFFEWNQNLNLNYHFENYYPATIQKIPSYPLESSYYGNINTNYDYTNTLPYPAFMLGPRQLPIYYVNAIYLFDCQFYLKWILDYFYIIIGTSNGESGLDANSSKSFIAKTGYKNNSIEFCFGVNIGERGSVPIKIHNKIISLYFEYSDNKFTFAFESILNLHGIKDPRLNPYQLNDGLNIHLYNFGNGLFIPDDLPNLIDDTDSNGKKPPLYGLGGFIYLSYSFYLKNNKIIKIFFHYSLYDPHIFNESYLIYQLKHRIVTGIKFETYLFAILFGATFTYDNLFLQIPQFFEAESRIWHKIVNYDLIFSIIVNL